MAQKVASNSKRASDRSSLIRLASSMEKGSPERRAILAGIAKIAIHPDWDDDPSLYETESIDERK